MQGGVRRPRGAINLGWQIITGAAPQWTTKAKTAAFRMMTRLLSGAQRWVKRFNNDWELTACRTPYFFFLKCPHYNLHRQDSIGRLTGNQTRDKYTTQGHNNVYDTALAVWRLVTLPQAGESVWKVTLHARTRTERGWGGERERACICNLLCMGCCRAPSHMTGRGADCSPRKLKSHRAHLCCSWLVERVVPIKFTSNPAAETRRDAISGLLAIPSFFFFPLHINST